MDGWRGGGWSGVLWGGDDVWGGLVSDSSSSAKVHRRERRERARGSHVLPM